MIFKDIIILIQKDYYLQKYYGYYIEILSNFKSCYYAYKYKKEKKNKKYSRN